MVTFTNVVIKNEKNVDLKQNFLIKIIPRLFLFDSQKFVFLKNNKSKKFKLNKSLMITALISLLFYDE